MEIVQNTVSWNEKFGEVGVLYPSFLKWPYLGVFFVLSLYTSKQWIIIQYLKKYHLWSCLEICFLKAFFLSCRKCAHFSYSVVQNLSLESASALSWGSIDPPLDHCFIKRKLRCWFWSGNPPFWNRILYPIKGTASALPWGPKENGDFDFEFVIRKFEIISHLRSGGRQQRSGGVYFFRW